MAKNSRAEFKKTIEDIGSEPDVCSELLDKLPDSIIIHNFGRQIVYANRHAYESRGYTLEKILKLKIEDMVIPSERKKIEESIKENMAKGMSLFETVQINENGSETPVEVWVKPIIFKGEQCLIGVSRDITERKTMQEELVRENVKTRLYLNLVPVIVMALDCFGTVTMINEYGAQIIGYPEEMIVGKNWFENFIPEDESDGVKKVFTQIISGDVGLFGHFESKIKVKGGGTRVIAWKNSFINGPTGGIATILSSGTDVTEIRHIQTQIENSHNRLERVIDGIVGALSKTVETKDPYTAGHQARVALLAREMAKEIGLSESDVREIYMASTIHDIGKIYVPAEILNKPGALSNIEFGMIKLHSQTGYEVLKDIDFVGPVAKMVLQHHERIDGSGYPNGVSGEDILKGARIIAVSDVVEAMSSHRPYRAGLGIAPALEEISTKRGVLYDNDAVGACLELFNSQRFSFPD